LLVAIIISFLIVIIALPRTIDILREKGYVGIDVHKPDRPEIAKGGGFVVLLAIVTALLIVIGLTTFQVQDIVNPGLLAALVSILMAGMIGILDDNLDFRNRTKIALPMIASIPMMVMQVGTTTMSIPFFGTIDLGVLYPLVVVPLMMTFIIDSTNMYGGMNGLEVGLSTVNSSALIVYIVLLPLLTGEAVPQTQIDAGVVAGALLGASLAFLAFNRYPARILPGDVGRLPLGAAMAAALILGNMDRLAVFLYAPFGLNFLMYVFYRVHVRRTNMDYEKFAYPRDDGTLEVAGPYTVYWLLPHYSKKITEKRNVILLVLIQAIIAYAAVLLLLANQLLAL
jgi:UDP-N-acetylglucosamine--dolichyl-phosphate N-acetylglucosaminephosphotransferase